MLTSFPWLSLLGVGVALAVGVIAFLVASGLVNGRDRARAGLEQDRPARGPNGIRRAS
jgi:hypothetical protein